MILPLEGVGECFNANVHVLAWSVIRTLMVRTSSFLFILTMLTILLLSVCHWPCWLAQECSQWHQLVQCHVLSCLCNNACKRVGHCVPLAGICLSLYSLHVLNRDINMIKKAKPITGIMVLRLSLCLNFASQCFFVSVQKSAEDKCGIFFTKQTASLHISPHPPPQKSMVDK